MGARVSLKEQAYGQLRDAILAGELENGSHHSVYRLADQLGMSRTPVREAVLQLADAGLVTIERNRGITIQGLTVDDIRDIFELRLLTEVPAVAYAAAHGSDRFRALLRAESDAMAQAVAQGDGARFRAHDRALHDLIAGELSNDRLSSMLGTLRDATTAHGAWTGDGARELSEIMQEHGLIVDALLSRDPDVAARTMTEHLVQTGTLLMSQSATRTGETVDADWWRRTSLDAHGQ